MAEVRDFSPDLLFAGALFGPDFSEEAKRSLEELFKREWGDPVVIGPDLPFSWTDYYDAEMGSGIIRRFYAFRPLVDPQRLADIKLQACAWESKWTAAGSRNINIDPGLLNLSRVVLATTKDRAHRIPLQKGIFGEVTVLFRRNSVEALPWSYPDYRSAEYAEILREMRNLYKKLRA